MQGLMKRLESRNYEAPPKVNYKHYLQPTIVQGPPNRYEADAGQKKMVVDPALVNKRGNIDKIYTVERKHS